MLKDIIAKVVNGGSLSSDEADRVIRVIAHNEVNDVQVAALIAARSTLHNCQTSTSEEMIALVRAVQKYSHRIAPVTSREPIDTAGTGGGPGTFNISTAAAFVAAAADIPVAKQGVRSIHNLAGGADVLEALGADIKLTPESVEQLISEVGIGFLYAPLYHPVLRRIFMLEQAIGVKSVLHTLLVPLTNAAGVRRHLLGVSSEKLLDIVAEIVKGLDYEHVLIVHGEDGTDEISITGPTRIIEIVKDNIVRDTTVTPEDFGFKRASLSDISDDEASANAHVLREILSGREQGPKRQAVILNAAGALVVGGKASTLLEGVQIATELIDDGWAEIKLHEMIEVSKRLPKLR